MKKEVFEKAVELADYVKAIFVATADAEGKCHIAAAGKLELMGTDSVGLTEWFCPGTVANLQSNKQLAVVVWDENSDKGYQLVGRLERVDDVGILDGYAAEAEGEPPLPQVKRRLVIKVEKIIDFKPGPHSDVEE